jgi:hypothetical protein
MKHNAQRQRRQFLLTTAGLGSAPIVSWATTVVSAQHGLSTPTNNFYRLPLNDEPVVISGRAVDSNQQAIQHQIITVAQSSDQTTTDADGRFFLSTTTSAFIHSKFQLQFQSDLQACVEISNTNQQIQSHLLTQDAMGNWRVYLNIQI